MHSFIVTLIVAALAAFASAAPIVNSDASIKDAVSLSDSHQSLGSFVSTRDVIDNELDGGLESRSSDDLADILKTISGDLTITVSRSLDSVEGIPDTLDGVPSGTLESLHLSSRDATVAGLKGKVNNLLSGLKRDVVGDAEGDVKNALFGRDLATDLGDKLKGVLSGVRA